MGGRLVAATLLLGGTLFLGIDTGHNFTDFTPRLLIGLIIGTYGASLGFALWLPRARRLGLFAAVQISWDLLVTTGLIYVAGGLVSIFSFLYGATVLMAALVVGPRAAQATTAVALTTYVTVGVSLTSGWLPPPPDQPIERYLLSADGTGFALLSNVVGLVLVSILATSLAARLRRAGGDLERAEASARDLARLNADIVRSLTSGLATADTAGLIRTINPAGARIFETAADELIGKPIWQLLPLAADARPGATSLVGPERGEGMATRPDGSTFPIGFSCHPLIVADGENDGSLVTFQDLTEIASLRQTAERAERLAALGRLAASLAHEIRNPLSSISGSVELVRDAQSLDDEDRHLLGIVVREVDRLNDLVTTMLQVGRPNEPNRNRQDLRILVDNVVEMARRGPAAGVDALIEPSWPEHPVIADVDGDQMRQVVWNLLKNALQASRRGGRVEVRVGEAANGAAFIEVADQGHGIAADARAKLFDTFYSGRPQGVGLGLALVKQIADAHQAELTVASSPEGTCFRIVVPRAEGIRAVASRPDSRDRLDPPANPEPAPDPSAQS